MSSDFNAGNDTTNSLEDIRRAMNQLQRELVLLIGDIETKDAEYTRRINNLKTRANVLYNRIDELLDKS